jgi:hypothetical protein
MQNKNIKNRYMSIRLSGEEIYIEDIQTDGDIKDSLKLGKDKLNMIKKAMPKGDWSITIENQSLKNGDTHFQILDVETEELQEQVL